MPFYNRSEEYAGIPINSGDIQTIGDVTAGQLVNINGVIGFVQSNLKKTVSGNQLETPQAFVVVKSDLVEATMSASTVVTRGLPIYGDPNGTNATTTKGNGTFLGYAYYPKANGDATVFIANFDGYLSGNLTHLAANNYISGMVQY